jgi:hypothetical protein
MTIMKYFGSSFTINDPLSDDDGLNAVTGKHGRQHSERRDGDCKRITQEEK